MIFNAKIWKDGKFWLAEVEALDAMTQGHSKKEAISMLKDWVRSSLGDPKFDVIVHEKKSGDFALITEETPEMIAFFLQRLRIKKGLTVRQVAHRLGFKSHTAYAQYEKGKSEPSVTQINKLLKALAPGRKVHLKF